MNDPQDTSLSAVYAERQETSRGVLRTALLIPKAVLKALWEAELRFREALGIKRERKQLRRSK